MGRQSPRTSAQAAELRNFDSRRPRQPSGCAWRRLGIGSGGRLWPRGFRGELVLRLQIKIARRVALVQLIREIAGSTVDYASTLHGGPGGDRIGPTQNVVVVLHT